jgi:hypothetical protein
MAEERGTSEINSAADMAQLRREGRILNSQELKELNAKVKALEEMAKIEDRFKTLEKRKRPKSPTDVESNQPKRRRQQQYQPEPSENPSSSHGHASSLLATIEPDDSEPGSPKATHYTNKQHNYTRGIKITPSYTLKTSSSLREWGDWKDDIERVFEGDPDIYRKSSQKILKALDYLDRSLKSLWFTHSKQQGVKEWPLFLEWTRENVHNGQNATATLYEQLNQAKQFSDQSPIQFNSYLAAIERDLPQQNEKASAMTFYSKLHRTLKQQFKTSDITIPETRAKCVSVAQRVWEGLHDGKPSISEKKGESRSASKYPQAGSGRDRKDQYHLSHRKPEHQETRKELVCFSCNKPGHYATDCPDRKPAKIQAARENRSVSVISSRSTNCSSPEPFQAPEKSDDSDSLN